MPFAWLLRSTAALLAVALIGVAGPALAGQPATPAVVPATGQTGDDPIRWAVAPAGPDGPAGRSWFGYDLAPGTEIVDWVGITNLGEVDLDFTVYPTDAYTTPDGAFALLPAQESPRGVGAWVTMQAGRHRVPAGHRLDIPFRLSVPDNATPGDHAGGIIAALTARQSNAGGQQLDLDRRVAARVYLRVAGPATPQLTVESVQVTYHNPVVPWGAHTMTVTYVLRNTGNLRVSGAARVRVSGPFGWQLAATGAADLPELLPGSTLTVTETLTGVAPAMRLTAAVAVDPVTADGPLPATTRSAAVWALPWLLLAAGLAVAGFLLVRVLARRRRRAQARRPAPAAA